MESFSVKTSRREQMVDITSQVREIVSSKGMGKGMVTVFVPHTTAAVTINEGADPSVQHDLLAGLAELVPHRTPYYQQEAILMPISRPACLGLPSTCWLTASFDTGYLAGYFSVSLTGHPASRLCN